MSRAVLDASAMVAFIRGEPGGDIVDRYIGNALASAVNVAEVGARLIDVGVPLNEVRRSIALMAVEIVPFDPEQAHAAAGIRDGTRSRGLSLGDRACLQLAARRGLPAVTADRAWEELDVEAEVRLIRDRRGSGRRSEVHLMDRDWREDVRSALRDFGAVSELAGEGVDLGSDDVEFLDAPHIPQALPEGRMAVYGFWLDGTWLKVGRAGVNSNARYVYQHYTGSAQSTLAGSIRDDPLTPEDVRRLNKDGLADWIKREVVRVNILLPLTRSKSLLSLLEAFLHVRLRPRYEG